MQEYAQINALYYFFLQKINFLLQAQKYEIFTDYQKNRNVFIIVLLDIILEFQCH